MCLVHNFASRSGVACAGRKLVSLPHASPPVTLGERSNQKTNAIHRMKNRALKNHLRTHRKRSALSQRQVGELLGYPSEAQVSRHERSKAIPHLLSAFGYQVIFRVPLRSLFPGIYEEVRDRIEKRLQELEIDLHGQTVRGPQAEAIARTLLWMMDRREMNSDTTDAG